MKNEAINLGDVAKDKISGFQGVVVAETRWLNNCRRLTLAPQKLAKDGKTRDSDTFDEMQLVLVKRGVVDDVRKTGGPRPEPQRARDPR